MIKFHPHTHRNLQIFKQQKSSAVKRLIVINRIQNKGFCLHNMCVYCVYIYIYK